MTHAPPAAGTHEPSPSPAPTAPTAPLAPPAPPALDLATLRHLVEQLRRTEDLQAEKVITLARRLKPGLTAEDIRNPHDFPELEDPDWHFEDGQLAAYQSVLVMLRGLLHERESEANEP